MKKREIMSAFILIVLLMPLISAGLLDWFRERIQLGPADPKTDVRVKVNDPPTIVSIDTSFSPLSLLAGTTTDVLFTFTAQDLDGAADLVDATAFAEFSKAGEASRSNACNFLSELGNQRTYQCIITMQYYDDNGIWDVTASIEDNAGTIGIGSSTFSIVLLRDISLSPAVINLPTVTQGQTDIQSSENTQITNNGNFDTATDGNIQITASGLTGETTPAETIPAVNFRAGDISESAVICTTGGSALSTISTSIPSISLPRGAAGSNTGTITYCLTLVPGGISSQFYSATQAGGNPWTIAI